MREEQREGEREDNIEKVKRDKRRIQYRMRRDEIRGYKRMLEGGERDKRGRREELMRVQLDKRGVEEEEEEKKRLNLDMKGGYSVEQKSVE